MKRRRIDSKNYVRKVMKSLAQLREWRSGSHNDYEHHWKRNDNKDFDLNNIISVERSCYETEEDQNS